MTVQCHCGLFTGYEGSALPLSATALLPSAWKGKSEHKWGPMRKPSAVSWALALVTEAVLELLHSAPVMLFVSAY